MTASSIRLAVIWMALSADLGDVTLIRCLQKLSEDYTQITRNFKPQLTPYHMYICESNAYLYTECIPARRIDPSHHVLSYHTV